MLPLTSGKMLVNMGKTYRADKRDYWDRNETYGWSNKTKKQDKKMSKADRRVKTALNNKRRIEEDRENDYE